MKMGLVIEKIEVRIKIEKSGTPVMEIKKSGRGNGNSKREKWEVKMDLHIRPPSILWILI